MKNIFIQKVPEDLYFKLIEWKGRIKANNWVDFLEKVIKILEDGYKEQ